ncbi:MAG TPA: translation initiation factor IF-6 [Candidatus Nanoarchaeia archaeon]|nr:translation initiation factor IF-6 [Candidatus Nanoarchaeia archaeon]
MNNDEHVALFDFHGDPNVGLHGLATDKFCLVGKTVTDKQAAELERKLKVPVIRATLYGMDLVGLFAVGNSSALIVPAITFEHELRPLRAALEKLGVKLAVIKAEHTAFGNSILVNDKIAIASKLYDKETVKQIASALGVKVVQMDLARTSVPGSVGKINNQGGIFSPNLTEDDIKAVEKLLGFEIGLGTINLGNPFISSGVMANSFGFAVGTASSGFEITRVDESLGFLR